MVLLDITTQQQKVMRGLYISLEVLFLFNISFALFNVVKYVCRMEERSWLIINFYILVFLQCSSHIIAISILAIEPDRNPSFYDVDFVKGTEKSIEALNYAMEMLGSCGMLVLGWLVVVTMYQLTLSLRVIF